MKVSVKREDLLNTLKAVSLVMGKGPQSKEIKLYDLGGKSFVFGHNGYFAIESSSPATIETGGGCTFNGEIFRKYIETLCEQDINIEVQRDVVHVSCGESRLELQNTQNSEFANKWQWKREGSTLQYNREEFLIGLEHCIFACAHYDDNVPILSGVNMSLGTDGVMNFVATDGSRLAWFWQADQSKGATHFNLTIYGKALKQLVKIASESNEEKITILNQVGSITRFIVGDITFSTDISDGQFPDYKTLVSVESTSSVVINRQEFLKVIQRLCVTANQRTNIIRIYFKADTLTCKSYTIHLGKITEKISIEEKTGELPELIAFNWKYLLDVLKVLTCDQIKIEMNVDHNNDGGKPVIIKGVGVEGYLYLLMPIQVKGDEPGWQS